MEICKDSKILLFRFSNYWTDDFIRDHKSIIDRTGYVWMCKQGKRSSLEIVASIIRDGGCIVLKEPDKCGGKYYIGHFTEITEDQPDDISHFPTYYLRELHLYRTRAQWLKINEIHLLPSSYVESLYLQKSGKKLKDQINRTSSAVMYITNTEVIKVDG